MFHRKHRKSLCCCFLTCSLNLPWWHFETLEPSCRRWDQDFRSKSHSKQQQILKWCSILPSLISSPPKADLIFSTSWTKKQLFLNSSKKKKERERQQTKGRSPPSWPSCIQVQACDPFCKDFVFPDGSYETDLASVKLLSESFSRNSGLFVFIYISSDSGSTLLSCTFLL